MSVAPTRYVAAKWTRLAVAGTPLLARSSHGLSVVRSEGKKAGKTAVQNRLYVFGGENKARHVIDSTLHTLDLSSASPAWTAVATTGTPPCARFAHGQAVVYAADGAASLYVFGGRQGITMDEKALNDLHRFDVRAGRWEPVAVTGTAPSPRSFHRMISAGSTLYVFGGCDNKHGRCNDVFAFDTATRVWRQLPTSASIKGRGGPSLFASPSGKALFVATGFSGEECGDIHRLDLASGKWAALPSDALRPRSVCVSATVGALHMIFGGEVDESAKGHEGAGEFAGDVVALADDGQLLPVKVAAGSAPRARGWSAGAALGTDSLVFYGGLAGSDAAPERLDDVWRLDVAVVEGKAAKAAGSAAAEGKASAPDAKKL